MKTSLYVTVAVVAVLAAVLGVVIFVVIVHDSSDPSDEPPRSLPVWGYQCVDHRCQRVAVTDQNVAAVVGLPVCRLKCSEPFGTLWPRPTGAYHTGNKLAPIDLNWMEFTWRRPSAVLQRYWEVSVERFREQVKNKLEGDEFTNGEGAIVVTVSVDQDSLVLNHGTSEHYRLSISKELSGNVAVMIEAENYFGARHALETLTQLIVYDNVKGELLVLTSVEIEDEPVFPHRGLSLDTVRQYVDVATIKRTIDALSMVKMNVFHWHITDTQSWPLVIKSHPVLHTYGAYSPKQIYTEEDVRDIVEYALARGVRIIPELDAPGHVGEGWEMTGLVECFKNLPWTFRGHFDPTKDKLYDILKDVYSDMNSMFSHSDMFHMGGDEVRLECWNSSTGIQQWMLDRGWNLEEADFMKLWDYFQTKALARLDKSLQDDRPIVLWTSSLTDEPYVDQYMDKNRYIIQVWTASNDPILVKLLRKGFRLIISNYDALYLDCGFAAWVGAGHNWCSPYKGWQEIYDNDIAAMGGQYSAGILGAEAAMWIEEADRFTIDSRLWPRASALAERLWTNPSEGWQAAESRMLMHRVRLVENGIRAETLQPTWCLQNEGICPLL